MARVHLEEDQGRLVPTKTGDLLALDFKGYYCNLSNQVWGFVYLFACLLVPLILMVLGESSLKLNHRTTINRWIFRGLKYIFMVIIGKFHWWGFHFTWMLGNIHQTLAIARVFVYQQEGARGDRVLRVGLGHLVWRECRFCSSSGTILLTHRVSWTKIYPTTPMKNSVQQLDLQLKIHWENECGTWAGGTEDRLQLPRTSPFIDS